MCLTVPAAGGAAKAFLGIHTCAASAPRPMPVYPRKSRREILLFLLIVWLLVEEETARPQEGLAKVARRRGVRRRQHRDHLSRLVVLIDRERFALEVVDESGRVVAGLGQELRRAGVAAHGAEHGALLHR